MTEPIARAIVCLPAGRIGNNPAAVVATQMKLHSEEFDSAS